MLKHNCKRTDCICIYFLWTYYLRINVELFTSFLGKLRKVYLENGQKIPDVMISHKARNDSVDER